MPREINPRAVFDRLFGDGASAEERFLVRIQRERSILDAVIGPSEVVCRTAWALATRIRFREYLETIREIERRIQLAEKRRRGTPASTFCRAHRHTGRSRGALAPGCWT